MLFYVNVYILSTPYYILWKYDFNRLLHTIKIYESHWCVCCPTLPLWRVMEYFMKELMKFMICFIFVNCMTFMIFMILWRRAWILWMPRSLWTFWILLWFQEYIYLMISVKFYEQYHFFFGMSWISWISLVSALSFVAVVMGKDLWLQNLRTRIPVTSTITTTKCSILIKCMNQMNSLM